MPKLLQINVAANWGSAGKIAELIGLCAMAEGWESFIAYGRFVNPSASTLIKIGSKIDPYLHYGEQRIFDDEGLGSRHATHRLIKQIEEINPDVVQLHDIHDHYLNYHVLFEYLNKTDIKVVWTFHDCWAFTGHCFHYVHKKCDRWKTGCHDCPMKQTLLDRSEKNWKLKKSLFTNCKNLTIVACSEWMGASVRESFFKDKRIEVIHNGIDTSTFCPQSVKEEASEKFTVLAVSNVWQRSKGLYDIFELRKILPDTIDMVIVGLRPEQLKQLPSGIKGVTRTQNLQELVQLYSDADVLINPTYADTFPTVNIEALGCGTPIVTYRTCGSPEAVSEDTGFVLEQGDINGMKEKILAVLNSGKGAYSEACRNRAVNSFNQKIQYAKYLDLYKQLLR